ncbi:hypothetical protein T10_5968, partial [Trichinella papuae]
LWQSESKHLLVFATGSNIRLLILKRPDTCDLGLLPEYNCTGLLFPLLPGGT